MGRYQRETSMVPAVALGAKVLHKHIDGAMASEKVIQCLVHSRRHLSGGDR